MHLVTVDRITRWPEVKHPLPPLTWPESSSAPGWPTLAHLLTSPLTGVHSSPRYCTGAEPAASHHHPQANGLCKWFHQLLKSGIKVTATNDCGLDCLPWVLSELRTAPREDLQASSGGLVPGQMLRVSGATTVPPGLHLSHIRSCWTRSLHLSLRPHVIMVCTSPGFHLACSWQSMFCPAWYTPGFTEATITCWCRSWNQRTTRLCEPAQTSTQGPNSAFHPDWYPV